MIVSSEGRLPNVRCDLSERAGDKFLGDLDISPGIVRKLFGGHTGAVGVRGEISTSS